MFSKQWLPVEDCEPANGEICASLSEEEIILVDREVLDHAHCKKKPYKLVGWIILSTGAI